MKKKMSIVFLGLVLASLLSLPVMAEPVEKTDSFVCPVIDFKKTPNENTPFVEIGEGHYSVIGPDVRVPVHATNGDGTGVPPGPHSEPGDTDYTAIWASQ
ncbi:hypothetical protein GF319_13135 [Candidatus Bathyarchaeota archaeon]|nr:hypothetical protein [Candidatus Bathyarchaeota archaeon]